MVVEPIKSVGTYKEGGNQKEKLTVKKRIKQIFPYLVMQEGNEEPMWACKERREVGKYSSLIQLLILTSITLG